MLKLTDIVKVYKTGDTEVRALNGVSIEFGETEFVAILGQSGCGKTTLLNIIGGLDRYTDGDLIINGISTKKYKNSDWDAYRNNSIGFVFQSYQLIPHQSVLHNVELTMTLSGISKSERRRRATEALKKVGLADQMHKRPNQMSGGQMQRAAIARALVNDPDIILADEPTGALDTQTSIQVMDILKEVSQNRLVIMVTHNPELAEKYATRIIRLTDGSVVSDTEVNQEPEVPEVIELVGLQEQETADEAETSVKVSSKKQEKKSARQTKKIRKKRSMSLFTAISLSLNNLMTKKGRTFLTAFAGAIGIIGIAMILALSTGVQNYIDRVESDTLSSYPLQINRETVDFAEMMGSMMGDQDHEQKEDEEGEPVITEIRSSNMMTNMITSIANEKTENDLGAFKKYAENNEELKENVQAIEYRYATTLNAYNMDAEFAEAGYQRVNPSTVMDNIGMTGSTSSSMISMMGSQYDVWAQLPESRKLMETMYEVVDGRLPENYDEVVLAVTERGSIGDYALYALGLEDQEELKDLMQEVMSGSEIEKKKSVTYSFEELENLKFTVLPNTDYYEKQEDGTYLDRSDDEEFVRKQLNENGIELKIVGIVYAKQNSGGDTGAYGGILYQPSLMEELIRTINKSEIVKTQQDKPETDVFTGIDFPKEDEEAEPLTMEALQAYIASLPEEDGKTMQAMVMSMQQQGLSDEEILKQFEPYLNRTTDATYEGNLDLLGVADMAEPDVILIYPRDFETKEKVVDILDAYSESLGEEEDLKYTDYVGLIMSSVTRIINVITYILIGFVGISLVVSSIMIGIITYISVLERTREIGILRSIGASKHDISRVFNAETLLIGFVSGIIGVVIPYAVSIFVNAIVYEHFEVENIMYLSPYAAVALVFISMLLTFIGGLIPSRIAAQKDPVEALRTE